MLVLVNPKIGHYEWRPSESKKAAVGQFVMRDCKTHLELWAVSILEKEDQGKGYGQQMIREAIEIANGRQLKLYVLKSNAIAIHVYEKCGFQIVGTFEGDRRTWVMEYAGTAKNE